MEPGGSPCITSSVKQTTNWKQKTSFQQKRCWPWIGKGHEKVCVDREIMFTFLPFGNCWGQNLHTTPVHVQMTSPQRRWKSAFSRDTCPPGPVAGRGAGVSHATFLEHQWDSIGKEHTCTQAEKQLVYYTQKSRILQTTTWTSEMAQWGKQCYGSLRLQSGFPELMQRWMERI